MSEPSSDRRWTPSRLAAGLFFALFLLGIQVLLPITRIPSRRAVSFGWHMYAHGPERVVFRVVDADGEETLFDEGGFFARNRPEIRAERWIPEVLCREIADARLVRVEIEEREPWSHRCE